MMDTKRKKELLEAYKNRHPANGDHFLPYRENRICDGLVYGFTSKLKNK